MVTNLPLFMFFITCWKINVVLPPGGVSGIRINDGELLLLGVKRSGMPPQGRVWRFLEFQSYQHELESELSEKGTVICQMNAH